MERFGGHDEPRWDACAAPKRESCRAGGRLSVAVPLTAAGGFLDAFAWVAHGHVFANAMSGNVALLGIHAAAGEWRQAPRHVPPLFSGCVERRDTAALRTAALFGAICLSFLAGALLGGLTTERGAERGAVGAADGAGGGAAADGLAGAE
jgi:uncharacterized membrane protein YoaK (UPF0700 family)